jgi:hypothetical protein
MTAAARMGRLGALLGSSRSARRRSVSITLSLKTGTGRAKERRQSENAPPRIGTVHFNASPNARFTPPSVMEEDLISTDRRARQAVSSRRGFDQLKNRLVRQLAKGIVRRPLR